MFKRSPEQTQALAAVMRAPGGMLVWEMLLAMAHDRDREARKLDGSNLYRAQGAAEAYEQLASDMEAALKPRPAVHEFRSADRSAGLG